jgi:hypothetical protein
MPGSHHALPLSSSSAAQQGAELKRRWAMARADLAALLGRINGGEAAAA